MTGWRRFATTEALFFVALFVCLMAMGPSSLMRDPGIFWHLRVGNHVLETGTVIRADTFSSTFPGKQWLAHAWLFELVQALLQRIDGFDTLLLATAASLAAFYAWVVHRLLRAGLQPIVAVLIVTLGVAATAYQFQPRPLIVSIFLFGWMFARLADFEAGRIELAGLLWLVPAIVAWTNIHGAVVGGLVTLAMCAGGWTVAPLVGWRSPIDLRRSPINLRRSPIDVRRFAMVWALVVACFLSVLVNPYGFPLVRQWFSVVSSPQIARLMMEHAPVRFSDPASWNLVGFGLLYIAAVLGVPFRQLRVTWMLPLVWFAMACSRVRHGPLFAITATLALAEMFPYVRWIDWLTRHGSELLKLREPPARGAGARSALAPALLVGLCLLLQVERVSVPVLGHGWNQLDRDWWPLDLLPDLQSYERSHPGGTAIFNEMLFGGFLIYFTPGLGVFIDDRCELYGDQRLAEYGDALAGDMSWFDRWTEQYGFGLALVVPGSPFDDYLHSSARWELVRQTNAATLFRRLGAN